ncbi:Uncharacterized protein SCF082_LOCUS18707 [Durusdinium trenchii]|uniref:Alkaline ceramidase n=1 Tax=Durusdinium trenchii TaxID=1381693 RepID=A0ABP0KRP8_9DINO
MRRTLFEELGLKSKSCRVWDSHVAVGLSCFAFAPSAAAFWAVFLCLVRVEIQEPGILIQMILYPLLGCMYTLVVITSYLADFLFIKREQRSLYGRVDIAFASATFFLSMFDYYLRATFWETMMLVVIALAAFAWSGQSQSFEIWVWRHSLWHVIGGSVALYGALMHLPAADRILSQLPLQLLLMQSLYGLAICVFLVIRQNLDKKQQDELWSTWAVYADWQLHPSLGEAPKGLLEVGE